MKDQEAPKQCITVCTSPSREIAAGNYIMFSFNSEVHSMKLDFEADEQIYFKSTSKSVLRKSTSLISGEAMFDQK